jgi:hypothetical protein
MPAPSVDLLANDAHLAGVAVRTAIEISDKHLLSSSSDASLIQVTKLGYVRAASDAINPG